MSDYRIGVRVIDNRREYHALIRLPPDMTIPSTNQLYLLGRGGKHVYKNPEVVTFQNTVIQLCTDTSLFDIRRIASDVSIVDLVSVTFLLKERFYDCRDVTNLIKALEDAIARVIGVDDSKTQKFLAQKAISPANYEAMLVTVNLTMKS